MSTIQVRLPNSLHRQLRECAKADGTSVNQLISSAVAEKLAALMTEDYLNDRARRASRRKFETALRSIPDREADRNDALATSQSPRQKRNGRRSNHTKGK